MGESGVALSVEADRRRRSLDSFCASDVFSTGSAWVLGIDWSEGR